MEQESFEDKKEEPSLETGTYELLSHRLKQNGNDLKTALHQLNIARKDVFGTIENKLVGTERITTSNNCLPWDMISIGNQLLFGYNVHMGLKTETEISDVFNVYEYRDYSFHEKTTKILDDTQFISDFKQLYKYYKNTYFVKFYYASPFLHMVFRTGKDVDDIKTLKWRLADGKLVYEDNRSAHEFTYPDQHQFRWKRTTRDDHRDGKHPHVSIDDKVFVETIGGDLTIKVEDNTDDGIGIYREPVEHQDQTLIDGEIHYTHIGHLVLLKIKPYQEHFRYIVYNSKLETAVRIDALKESCILLPDDQGVIFANGYYLQSGIYKKFEGIPANMVFEKRIDAPNGEDFLYIFYNKENGIYFLLNYNLIAQKVDTPLSCHGFTLFENGEMCLFKADKDPKKHHSVQIWQTPFTHADFQPVVSDESLISKIGNKEIVRAMAECHDVIHLIEKEDIFSTIYIDIIKLCTDILDSYHWLDNEELYALNIPLDKIKETSAATVEEYEKVKRIKQSTKTTEKRVFEAANNVIADAKKLHGDAIQPFVQLLSDLRGIRGEVSSLKDLRYCSIDPIDELDLKLDEYIEDVSQKCVRFLLKEHALSPYTETVETIRAEIDAIKKVKKADQINLDIDQLSNELKMLIDTVNSLSIDDATETTRIIDRISNIYADVNQIKSALNKRRNTLLSQEGKAEFTAQLKLLDQATINFLDIADTPDKTDEFLTKLMVQVEELEGKFSNFDEFIIELTSKRENIYNAFEAKKVALIEARNKRAVALQQAAERIINSIKSRIGRLETVTEIKGYLSSDLMVDKLRKIVEDLKSIGDTVKAEDLLSQLKSTGEEAIRQLKDKSELYLSGEDVIAFGNYHFAVNKQKLNLTLVPRKQHMFYHLTGTSFFERIQNPAFNALTELWSQEFISESQEVYRCEFLMHQLLEHISNNKTDFLDQSGYLVKKEKALELIRTFMSTRYNEGYLKGVHDHDTYTLLHEVIKTTKEVDLLRYPSNERAFARLFWHKFIPEAKREILNAQIKGAGKIIALFPNTSQFNILIEEITTIFKTEANTQQLAFDVDHKIAATYLFEELSRGDQFVMDQEAADLYSDFIETLEKNDAYKTLKQSIQELNAHTQQTYQLIRKWIMAYLEHNASTDQLEYLNECAVTLLLDDFSKTNIITARLKYSLEDFLGEHPTIHEGTYAFNYNRLKRKLVNYHQETVPKFNELVQLKKELTQSFSDQLRLSDFTPRVLSSFVRNQLINDVYLPLIGANLAKQIGVTGKQKRTDLNGLLLLISPPGYGKTTLMEYIANRLGIIFMKINGPSLGHHITSLDPNESGNAAAKEELEKLNLAFEMGDNVMIYLDDIQHCNPEFLQKFISLCDAQRKIEGVYKGRSKTYDFRGKKVCVIMAGNPYTESGQKFQIPDMLANRADIYNLGDIIGDTEELFKLSYLENALTSNAILKVAAGKSHNDVIKMIQIAETNQQEGITFEANHTKDELTECIEILKNALKVRDVVYAVNQNYIASAAQSDEYRTEPTFKLQGSYRDMNKIMEKLVPVMNDDELQTLIISHYQNESQTLTSGAESNLLKFKSIYGIITQAEQIRWNEILERFQKAQLAKGYGDHQTGLIVEQMEAISLNLEGIKDEVLKRMNDAPKH